MAWLEVNENQLLDRIKFENPWWKEGKIDDYYASMRRRLYFPRLYELVSQSDVNRAVVLMGPRRVGKTVMLFHAIQALIEKGVNPHKICYLSIETPIFNSISIEELFRLCRKAVGKEEDLDGYYVFFDEVQYLKDWEVHLKSLVDSYRNVRFVVSGSAAAALKFKSGESGAGRFTEFTLPPLTFHEYIHLKKLESLIIPRKKKWGESEVTIFDTVDIQALNEHFVSYINFGGYPEVSLSEAIQANPGRYIKSDIVDKVLLRDLPILYGIQDIQELNALFTSIAFNSGNEFSYEKLSQASGVSKTTLRKYISYLDAAFLIRVVDRLDKSGKKFKRATQFKIYLTNPSLRSALFSPISPTDDIMGNMVETAIYAQWFHRLQQTPYYARWSNGEVDIVGLKAQTLAPAWAVEVKWSNRYKRYPKELKSLTTFLQENNLTRAIITTIDTTEEIEKDGLVYDFMPAALYCYTIGRRTLESEET